MKAVIHNTLKNGCGELGIYLNGSQASTRRWIQSSATEKNGCGYIQIEFYFKRLSSDFSHGPEFPKLRSINVLASLNAGKGLFQKAYMAMC